jgi:hypothetical protein
MGWEFEHLHECLCCHTIDEIAFQETSKEIKMLYSSFEGKTVTRGKEAI